MTEPAGAVFLSYASQDAEVARRICEALRAAGIEVWFDQSELRGGDAWDHKIRQQVRECALFVPVISEHTQERPEGYFRLEWDLADQRSHMIAHTRAFILPICVDQTTDRGSLVPESFVKVQWTWFPRGEPSLAFCERVKALISGPEVAAMPQIAARASQPTMRKQASHRWIAITAAAALVLTVGGWQAWRMAQPKRSSSVAVTTVTAMPEKSIAVLPFLDMSEKHDQEYFSDGLSEELINHLAHSPDLKVIARASSFAFKGKNEDMRAIATKLGVANLLEGSVRKAGSELRITAQLVRASDGVNLWSQTYERKVSDIFKLQDDISTTVANSLHAALTARSPSAAEAGTVEAPVDESTAEAYTLLLRGNYFEDQGTEQGNERATDLYKQATSLKPDYALAWANVGHAYFRNGQLTEARQALLHALQLDPNVMRAHYTLAEIHYGIDWDWSAAQTEIDRMRQVEPNNAFLLPGAEAELLEIFGRLDEALAIERRTYDRNPLSRIAAGDLAGMYFHAGRYEESLSLARQFLELNPHAPGLNGLVSIDLLFLRRPVEALTAIKKEADESARLAQFSMIYWAMGRRKESDASLKLLNEKYGKDDPYGMAAVFAYRGDADAAFAWLDRAYGLREESLTMIKVDPVLASLRGDPRYKALLRKMNLPEL